MAQLTKRAARRHAIWAVVALTAGQATPASAAIPNPHSCIAAENRRPTEVSFLLYAGHGVNLPLIGHWTLAPNAPMGDLTMVNSQGNVRGAEFTINAPRDVSAAEEWSFDGTQRPGKDGFTCDGTTTVIFH